MKGYFFIVSAKTGEVYGKATPFDLTPYTRRYDAKRAIQRGVKRGWLEPGEATVGQMVVD